ncbi:winged helix-turn-helix domain-containing protein [Methylobacterium radiodurans]|uniref:LysR family transcriptional regulator n=1 Tax=Methylobacterium radiodurans TaxID=2202828 RepID=A0A2U8VMD0_9HYPH|nr:LysR family transcriptional regulator [Methylobacterium radiodurans]AWN34829.1 LysR family transcriptional regulator [Methylobacterium radiodurans]
MTRLSIRIDLGPGHRVGPGKVRLLEAVAEHGSISAAGRALGMSYRRAWTLIEALNAGFGRPVVEAQAGGRAGGGARLSSFGAGLVADYRALERAAERAAAPFLARLSGPDDAPRDHPAQENPADIAQEY